MIFPESRHCNSPDEFPGTCVELSECDNLLKLRHKVPQMHIDRLYVSLSRCGFQNNQPMVCCTKSSFPIQSLGESSYQQLAFNPVQETTQRPSTHWTFYQPQTQRTTLRPFQLETMQPVQARSYNCAGVIDNRIYGGSETKINEMPFTAIIAYFKCKNDLSNGRALTQSALSAIGR